jgi:CheY-like chemotaxis protein
MKGLVQRGAELARQLLGFSRRGKYDVAPRDVRQIVQSTVDMFGRTRRDLTFVLDFAPGLDAALMDHAQLEQALLNLFINSAHAMPSGGQLIVRGENAVVRDEQAAALDVRAGRFVRLTVADTGSGIEPAVLPRIFEPFFTTKEAGQGSGLGLASVYGIIKNHGGAIHVASDVAKGTTFTILLPAADAPARGAVAAAAGARTGQGTVLVVDDEELPLKLSARLLTSLGYHVLTASRGRDAIELVRQRGDTIALVVLDLTMPEMSGAATFDQLRAIAPSLKVLLASGYSVEGQAQALLDRGCDGFIQKPFSASALSAKIRSLGIA